jgi:predicted Fe-Mo cluster-binding NifX family protein
VAQDEAVRDLIMQKVLITLLESDIAPRFDLATEVVIATVDGSRSSDQSKTLVLAHPSAEEMCQLILEEGIDVVICGGIEEEFYDYLTWKQVRVIDSVAGPWQRALEGLAAGSLRTGDILFERPGGESHGPE